MRLRAIAIWAIFISLFSTEVSSASVPVCLELFQKKTSLKATQQIPEKPKPREMTIWRYGDSKDFMTPSISIWDFYGTAYSLKHTGQSYGHGRGYYPVGRSKFATYDAQYLKYQNPAKIEWESQSIGTDFLLKNQAFALAVMENRKYINDEIKQGEDAISDRLEPNQVTFFELTEQSDQKSVMKKYGKVPSFARLESQENAFTTYMSYFAPLPEYDIWDMGGPEVPVAKPKPKRVPKPNPTYQVKIATSYLVSGQTYKGEPLDVPLQGAEISNPIDRLKMPYLWEMGRAAQTEPGAFVETLKASLYFAYREMLLLGGNFENSFVVAHSLDPIHTRLYKSQFHMTEYAKYLRDPSGREVVLVAQLKDLLELFPPNLFLPYIEPIRSASQVREGEFSLDAIEAFELYFKTHQMSSQFLETHEGSVGTIRDFSGLSAYRAVSDLKLPLSVRDQMLQSLFEVTAPYVDRVDHFQQDIKNQPMSRPFEEYSLREYLYKKRTIEISVENKSEERAHDVFIATLKSLIDQLKAEGIQDPATFLDQKGITVSLRTKHSGIYWGLRKEWPFVDEWSVETFDQYTLNGGFFNNQIQKVKNGEFVGVVTFKLSDVIKLIEQNESSLRAVPGREHIYRHLYWPELYTGG